MRCLRKRLKSTSKSPEQSQSSSARVFQEESVNPATSYSQLQPHGFKVDTSMFESGSLATRCSVRLIHEVISKFDSLKRDIVKSIGFGGILSFPPIKQFNRKFSLWLMSCVNEETSSINISQQLSISFNKHDVGHVFGITTSGKRVLDVLADSREAKDRVIERFLGPGFKEHRSVKIAQEIIERHYVYPMSKEDSDSFRAAFVVFVMSNLLSPSAKYDYACIDYWNAIQVPDAIGSYDWAEYVIFRLFEGVSKLKQDISNNIKFLNISGCCLFLQVLYLDSLELDGLSMPHNSFPRVQHFSFETLRRMILADKNYSRYLKDDHDLPVGKLRVHDGCIYSWADGAPEVSEDPTGCSLFAIWESAVAMVHLFNIPLEAAGPVFVAAADFQNQINSGIAVTGTQAIKIMSVLVSIMIPYTRGFRYQYCSFGTGTKSDYSPLDSSISNGIRLMSAPIRHKRKKGYNCVDCSSSKAKESLDLGSIEAEGTSSENCSYKAVPAIFEKHTLANHFERSLKNVWSSLDDMPHYLNVNLRVATAMSQFYSLMRQIKRANDFDLNLTVSDLASSPCSSSLSVGSECESVPSPWDLCYSWSLHDIDVSLLSQKLHSMEADERLAIVHRSPKYLQVVLSDMCSQFLGRCEMELDLFDAIIRLARQEDDQLFSSYGSLRWRYFFESDFMESIMSGSLDLLNDNLAYQLHGLNFNIDFTHCKIVFFPALLQFHWVCFAWQPDNNVISVFEASYKYPLTEPRAEVIARACYLLKLALQTLSRSVFSGLSNDVVSAELRMLHLVDFPHRRYNFSGLLCSFFYRCFDGTDLRTDILKVEEEAIAAKLLFQLVNLKENSGCLNHLFA